MPGLVEITRTAGHGKFQEPNNNSVPRQKNLQREKHVLSASEAIKEKIWTNDRCMIA
jgi:hypothetical protein